MGVSGLGVGELEGTMCRRSGLSSRRIAAWAAKGMSRRHAQYKMVAMVLGTNAVRRELGLPEAECLAADQRYSLAPPAPA